ncbi:MAG TPA: DUF3179 domain-containing (seleno)protein [Chitinophagaceae bacterium]|nr:DUF3179 domain-containing (seleno)protein [Chitinophagaceae bacterium]
MKRFVLVAGLLLLFAAEILRVYFIMPFPGSQQSNSIDIAYWLGRNITWIRVLLILLLALPVIAVFRQRTKWKKILLAVVLVLYATVFYLFNFRFEADKMFYQPKHKSYAAIQSSGADTVLVIGVAADGEAKAFPIQIIGYHHQVRDSIGHTPAIVTYCTVCRTGRVYSPTVDGKPETFRLVGMDHFNAMFEDASTKSWWQQATGIAVAGPLKGKALPEIPSAQMTLAAWLRLHPNSTVLQPDSSFTKQYKGLDNYNKGTIKGSLEKRDSASWQFKSWVVGVVHKGYARAYDWNMLVKQQLLQDSIPGMPIVIVLENDNASFHVWNRQVNGQSLHFTRNDAMQQLNDTETGSVWDMNGLCIEGALKGNRLATVQSYQEFWHSWKNFHPATTTYKN